MKSPRRSMFVLASHGHYRKVYVPGYNGTVDGVVHRRCDQRGSMQLFHFSENPDIRIFEPHVAPTSIFPDTAYVWAIDEWHAPMYYLPRDCPRACFWPGPDTIPEDAETWFGGIHARMVIAVESGWLDRIRSTALYRYTMPDDTFTLLDATAGHWVSRSTVRPVCVEPVGDLLEALVGASVELRLTPALLDLWQRVISSTLAYSGTRLRNAQRWDVHADS